MKFEQPLAILRKRAKWFVIGLDLALLALVTVLFYLTNFRLLVAEWFRPGVTFYSHGPIVVCIFLLLILRQRRAFGRPHFDPWGSLPILATVLLFLLGDSWNQPYIVALSFVILLLGVVAISFGRTTAQALLFPILYLVVAIPLPPVFWAATSLTRPVGELTVDVLQLFGVEATYSPTMTLFRGTIFPTSILQIKDYTYLIVPLCTGVNFILALLALLLPLLYITHSSRFRTTLFVVAIPLTALTLKVLLLAAVVAVTPSVGLGKAEELYHGWLGVPTFLVGFLLLLLPLLATRPRRALFLGAWKSEG